MNKTNLADKIGCVNGRQQGKDSGNLMELLKKQSENNKPIIYVNRKEKKVILTDNNFKQLNLKAKCWDIALTKNLNLKALKHYLETLDDDTLILKIYNSLVNSDEMLTEEELSTLKEGLK